MADAEPGNEVARSELRASHEDRDRVVEVTGKVGSGHLVARPPRRTFWQWLTRQPGQYEMAAR
jgi:hypothetical protein